MAKKQQNFFSFYIDTYCIHRSNISLSLLVSPSLWLFKILEIVQNSSWILSSLEKIETYLRNFFCVCGKFFIRQTLYFCKTPV